MNSLNPIATTGCAIVIDRLQACIIGCLNRHKKTRRKKRKRLDTSAGIVIVRVSFAPRSKGIDGTAPAVDPAVKYDSPSGQIQCTQVAKYDAP